MALQDTRHLVQISRQSLQEASLRLKEDNVDSGLNQALKGCLVALRAAEVRKKRSKGSFNNYEDKKGAHRLGLIL